MPQLNPEFYLSQLFWLIITFSFLLIFLWKISLPRISAVLEKRESKINNDIITAKKIQTEAEKIQIDINEKLQNTRDQNNEMVKKLSIDFQNKTSEKLKQVEKELLKKMNESPVIIENNKNKSLKQIDDQLIIITKLILSKLSSIPINHEKIKNEINNTKTRTIN